MLWKSQCIAFLKHLCSRVKPSKRRLFAEIENDRSHNENLDNAGFPLASSTPKPAISKLQYVRNWLRGLTWEEVLDLKRKNREVPMLGNEVLKKRAIMPNMTNPGARQESHPKAAQTPNPISQLHSTKKRLRKSAPPKLQISHPMHPHVCQPVDWNAMNNWQRIYAAFITQNTGKLDLLLRGPSSLSISKLQERHWSALYQVPNPPKLRLYTRSYS